MPTRRRTAGTPARPWPRAPRPRRGLRRRGGTALLLAALCATPAAAVAGRPDTGRPDAPVERVRLELPLALLDRGLALLEPLAWPRQRALISLAASAGLGFDPLRPGAWTGAGLSGAGSLLLSLRDPGSGWHLQLVAPVADAQRLDDLLGRARRWLPAIAGPALRPVVQADTPAQVRALLGSAGLHDARRWLERRPRLLALRLGSRFVVLVQRQQRQLIVDLLAVAPRPAARGALAALEEPSTTAGSAAPATALLWASAAGLPLLARAGEDLGLLRPTLAPAVRAAHSDCHLVERVFHESALRELRLEFSPDGARPLSLTWTGPGSAVVSRHLLARDDGLALPGTGGAVAAGSFYLDSGRQLRSMPRSSALTRGAHHMLRKGQRCLGSEILPAVFAWPELLAALLDDVAAVGPRAALIVDSLRNLSVAVRRLRHTARPAIWAGLASVDAPAAAALRELYDLIFGRRALHRTGAHQYTLWGRGPLRGVEWGAPERQLIGFGGGHGEGAVAWFLARQAGPGSAAPPLAEAVVDLAALARQAGVPSPVLALLLPAPRPAALHARLDVTAGAISLTALLR
jgi:hypothetical protein